MNPTMIVYTLSVYIRFTHFLFNTVMLEEDSKRFSNDNNSFQLSSKALADLLESSCSSCQKHCIDGFILLSKKDAAELSK